MEIVREDRRIPREDAIACPADADVDETEDDENLYAFEMLRELLCKMRERERERERERRERKI